MNTIFTELIQESAIQLIESYPIETPKKIDNSMILDLINSMSSKGNKVLFSISDIDKYMSDNTKQILNMHNKYATS